VLAGLLALRGLGLPDSLVWPVALCAGGLILARRPPGRRGAPPFEVVAGVALLGLGLVTFVRENAGGASAPLVAPSGVAVALLLVLGPWAWRLARERDAERLARIRSEERAEVAARVHDSVLQTLALIQREADDPRRVAALARGQERTLRASLYGDPRPATDSLAAALEEAAAEVEGLHGVRIEVVHTGDRPLDDGLRSVVLAAREAMTNAALHTGADEVSVFVDAGDDAVSVYVRDRGRGFDPAAVPADRRGIAESIHGRMRRAGGSADVRSSPGEGTEVELTLPGGGA
jgi:signal transduction histidine kinase